MGIRVLLIRLWFDYFVNVEYDWIYIFLGGGYSEKWRRLVTVLRKAEWLFASNYINYLCLTNCWNPKISINLEADLGRQGFIERMIRSSQNSWESWRTQHRKLVETKDAEQQPGPQSKSSPKPASWGHHCYAHWDRLTPLATSLWRH